MAPTLPLITPNENLTKEENDDSLFFMSNVEGLTPMINLQNPAPVPVQPNLQQMYKQLCQQHNMRPGDAPAVIPGDYLSLYNFYFRQQAYHENQQRMASQRMDALFEIVRSNGLKDNHERPGKSKRRKRRIIREQMYCRHCKKSFLAKPTSV